MFAQPRCHRDCQQPLRTLHTLNTVNTLNTLHTLHTLHTLQTTIHPSMLLSL
jgi:hypothetical protein